VGNECGGPSEVKFKLMKNAERQAIPATERERHGLVLILAIAADFIGGTKDAL
jgi:hypothetical protein